MTVLPADPTNVVAVVKSALAGDVVELDSGTYEPLVLKAINRESPGVLIRPAEGADLTIPGCEMNKCSGLTLDLLPLGVAVRVNTGITVTECVRVALTRLKIDGGASVVQDGNALGIRVRDCGQVLVRGCEVKNCGQGLSHLGNEHVEIDRNDFHHLFGETDAIRGASSFLRITNNRGWSFFPVAGWHVDFIQLWTANVAESPHDIHIEGNEFRQMDGATAQGVFCGNEDDLPYENLTIRDNCISGSSYNGILAELAPAAVLDLNVVVGFVGPVNTNGQPIIPFVALRRNTDGQITGNVAPNVKTIDSVNVEMTDNLIVPLVEPGDYSIADQWRERRDEATGGGGGGGEGGGCCGHPERDKLRRLVERRGARRVDVSYLGDDLGVLAALVEADRGEARKERD